MPVIPIPQITFSVSYKGAKKSELLTLAGSEDSEKVFRLLFNDGTIHYIEEFILLCLNQANKVIGYHKLSSGGQTGVIADIRIIAMLAINCGANQLIVAHNHPSGNKQPSGADKEMTIKLRDALRLFDIRLLDHLILTDESYLSMNDEGYM